MHMFVDSLGWTVYTSSLIQGFRTMPLACLSYANYRQICERLRTYARGQSLASLEVLRMKEACTAAAGRGELADALTLADRAASRP